MFIPSPARIFVISKVASVNIAAIAFPAAPSDGARKNIQANHTAIKVSICASALYHFFADARVR